MFRKTTRFTIFLLLAVATLAHADEVTDWNQTMLQAAHAGATSPLVVTRVSAIVHAAIFDAVNGIDPAYAPVHVQPAAATGASRRAAAVQAAYVTLASLYPGQQATFDAQRAASLARIQGDGFESSSALASGIDWGQKVADAMMEWRNTDGFTPAPPPFLGGASSGMWRPTPPANAPGAGPQFAYMKTWTIHSPSQFRPGGPPALNSARYAADFNEVKLAGSRTSSMRTPDQTIAVFFWNSVSAVYAWNNVALTLAKEKRSANGNGSYRRNQELLVENARLFALLNIAIADAAIACWDAKYTYVFWRPVTAVPLADADDNPGTVADSAWTPLVVTPAHPEYPSAHSALSGAAVAVLARHFGSNASFRVRSDTLFGAVRSFKNFRESLAELQNARIFGGIHFRSATADGTTLGVSVGNYVIERALLPVFGK